jgi:hypothetical protein
MPMIHETAFDRLRRDAERTGAIAKAPLATHASNAWFEQLTAFQRLAPSPTAAVLAAARRQHEMVSAFERLLPTLSALDMAPAVQQISALDSTALQIQRIAERFESQFRSLEQAGAGIRGLLDAMTHLPELRLISDRVDAVGRAEFAIRQHLLVLEEGEFEEGIDDATSGLLTAFLDLLRVLRASVISSPGVWLWLVSMAVTLTSTVDQRGRDREREERRDQQFGEIYEILATIAADVRNSSMCHVARASDVRTEPSTEAGTVDTLPAQSTVNVLDVAPHWRLVLYTHPVSGDVTVGWVAKRNLAPPPATVPNDLAHR